MEPDGPLLKTSSLPDVSSSVPQPSVAALREKQLSPLPDNPYISSSVQSAIGNYKWVVEGDISVCVNAIFVPVALMMSRGRTRRIPSQDQFSI